jgi:hypothetical protein
MARPPSVQARLAQGGDLRARADDSSHRQIARATGARRPGVRRILLRYGDPSPRLPGGQRLDDFNGAGVNENGGRVAR